MKKLFYEEIKTSCCKSRYKRLGTCHYICSKCKRDVSLEVFLIWECLEVEKKLEKKLEKK
jgi:hypothetical protein